MAAEGKALVLGGGGVTGVAWEIGLLHGLAESGVDLSDADVFIGTSAGSVVAAQLTSGVPLARLFADQIADPTGEITASIPLSVILKFVAASAIPGPRERGRRWLARAALKAKTVSVRERHDVIAYRVPQSDWPAQRLLVVTVDALTGHEKVFDAASGVPLVDAVAASCAVPLVWPPMPVGGRRYVDGGVRSLANVDLAKGYGQVVVVAPTVAALRRADRPTAQAAALGPDVRSIVVVPDAAAKAAIGRNVLDPVQRPAAAQAGLDQGRTAVDRIREVWS